MNSKVSAVAFLTVFSLSGIIRAEACSPGDAEYDEVFSPSSLVILAEVESYKFDIIENKVCYRTEYKIQKFIFGSHSDHIVVEHCTKPYGNHTDIEEIKGWVIEDNSETVQMFGNYIGANVLVYLTNAKPIRSVVEIEMVSEYRPAITSCWGVHQVNLDSVTEADRAEYLEPLMLEAAGSMDAKE